MPPLLGQRSIPGVGIVSEQSSTVVPPCMDCRSWQQWRTLSVAPNIGCNPAFALQSRVSCVVRTAHEEDVGELL
eukprot:1987298-Amphidinium_carterae.1